MRVRFDHDGIRAMWHQPRVQAFVDRCAGDVAANVRASAPDGGPHPGVRYRDTIATDTNRPELDAAAARVTTTDFAWHLIEYGSVNNPAYAPFRTGVERSGLRFHDPGPGGD